VVVDELVGSSSRIRIKKWANENGTGAEEKNGGSLRTVRPCPIITINLLQPADICPLIRN